MSASELVGYCTNIHPGVSLDQVKSNLDRFACEIKQRVSPNVSMPIGLWLANETCQQLGQSELLAFRDWLDDRGLLPFTLNGFPFGNFHQKVVKHDVYKPTWADPSRLNYTTALARNLSVLVRSELRFATISTLPLGWPPGDEAFLSNCAKHLTLCATELEKIRDETGVHIMLCMEPEPGCILDTADDVVKFFDQYVDSRSREFIGVCHDVCHSAVMFESQRTAIETYRANSIRIGKCQVSSALETHFTEANADSQTLSAELYKFHEPRYLHQTCVQHEDACVEFFEDLDQAFQLNTTKQGIWRTHFHVPIYAESVGKLGTTQNEIFEFLTHRDDQQMHFEIETYAWDVLPDDASNIDVQTNIEREIQWFTKALS